MTKGPSGAQKGKSVPCSDTSTCRAAKTNPLFVPAVRYLKKERELVCGCHDDAQPERYGEVMERVGAKKWWDRHRTGARDFNEEIVPW